MKLNYSEYEMSSHEKYYARRRNNKYVTFDQFNNGVSFQAEEKTLNIQVTNSNEFGYQYMFSEVSDEAKSHHIPTPEDDETRELFDEWNKENEIYKKQFADKFNIIFNESDPNLPAKIEEIPYNNVLSNTEITVQLGEGIIDFIYADIENKAKEIAETLQIEAFLRSLAKDVSTEDVHIFKNGEEEDFYLYERYESTMLEFKSLIYSSLYSTIFPPVFLDEKEKLKSLNIYYSYLKMLQKDYQEMIEFCFDEDFYPDVLGKLYPFERYNFFRSIKGYPVSSERNEMFVINPRVRRGEKMPYGMPSSEIIARLTGHIERTEQLHEFCEKYNMEEKMVEAHVQFPAFIGIRYAVNNLSDMLELEFTKMLESNIKFKKCKRCGKYFIMKGNYDTNYCDRIAEGETRNCQELAAQENYKAKIADDKAIPIYNKYYKRYAARVKVRQIKEADFKKWKYQAMSKRDECSNGVITPDEYIEWMEAAFPNRTPKK